MYSSVAFSIFIMQYKNGFYLIPPQKAIVQHISYYLYKLCRQTGIVWFKALSIQNVLNQLEHFMNSIEELAKSQQKPVEYSNSWCGSLGSMELGAPVGVLFLRPNLQGILPLQYELHVDTRSSSILCYSLLLVPRTGIGK